jgi:hypothetical protein
MPNTKLLRECARYLSSEGVYYIKNQLGIVACINGQFVMLEFADVSSPRKLVVSGGITYRPRTLQDFIEKVREIQSKTTK